MALPLNVTTHNVRNDEGKNELRCSVIASGLVSVDIETIAQEVSDKCTVTRADVQAVMAELEEYVAEQLLQGANVRMHALGSFRSTLRTLGTPQKEDCDATLIRAVNIRYTPSSYLSRLLALRRMKFEKSRAMLIAQAAEG